jgi:DNA-binding NarL/FixJ family response regulator
LLAATYTHEATLSGGVYVRKESEMKILIHLSNHLISETIHQLLVGNGYENVIISWSPLTNGVTPDILLVDIRSLDHNLLVRHPKAKILLMDTGIGPEKIIPILLSHKIHGVLSPHTELHLFKKALKVVSEGQFWIDNALTKALLHDWRIFSRTGPTGRISGRQQEIIKCVCQGLRNKEIAQRLAISEATVSRHLYIIFRILNVTSRAKLIGLAMNRPEALTA